MPMEESQASTKCSMIRSAHVARDSPVLQAEVCALLLAVFHTLRVCFARTTSKQKLMFTWDEILLQLLGKLHDVRGRGQGGSLPEALENAITNERTDRRIRNRKENYTSKRSSSQVAADFKVYTEYIILGQRHRMSSSAVAT